MNLFLKLSDGFFPPQLLIFTKNCMKFSAVYTKINKQCETIYIYKFFVQVNRHFNDLSVK